jgi:hypothetical protein
MRIQLLHYLRLLELRASSLDVEVGSWPRPSLSNIIKTEVDHIKGLNRHGTLERLVHEYSKAQRSITLERKKQSRDPWHYEQHYQRAFHERMMIQKPNLKPIFSSVYLSTRIRLRQQMERNNESLTQGI